MVLRRDRRDTSAPPGRRRCPGLATRRRRPRAEQKQRFSQWKKGDLKICPKSQGKPGRHHLIFCGIFHDKASTNPWVATMEPPKCENQVGKGLKMFGAFLEM